MKLRSLPSLLLSTSSLLFYLIDLCNSAAPADLPSGCPNVSTNQRALLDSCCYSTLLPGLWNATGQQEGITWVAAATGNPNCPQSVMVSSATDDWLITQYIITTLSSGRSATEVEVDIRFTCTGNCSSNLDLFYYPTDTEQSPSELTALRDNGFTRVGQVMNGSNSVTGITTSGFYLAIRATGDISVTINQISIILTVCGEGTVNLISFPEAYATALSVAGSCSANSEPSGSGTLTGTCGNDGIWVPSSSCVCSAGYFLDNDICTACPVQTYKSTAGNELCSPCPQNSEALLMGSTICNCQTNYTRPNSNAAAESCSECVNNFFLNAEGRCEQCPLNSMSSEGTDNSCTCFTNYTTMNGNTMTTEGDCLCRENYHISSSNQCVLCPSNSIRAIESLSSTCMCEPNRLTADGSTTTSGSVACNGCQSGYYLMDEMCLLCPENSESRPPLSNSCTCQGRSVTMAQSNTTTMDICSTCPVNWKSTGSSPLMCEMCPPRSERPMSQNITNCTCVAGYEMKSLMCLVQVIIPETVSTVKEGNAENPAKITLMLSADSYNFSVVYSINVDPMFRNRIPQTEGLFFKEGTREASIPIVGDDVALSPSYNVTVDVQSHEDYIGDGEITVTIVDDDSVGVGFLDSQQKVFNESDGPISITLIKTVTTAQDIMVDLVLSQGSSVSVVESTPVTLPAGPPGNVSVMLQIQNDVTGSENDESVQLTLKLVSPMKLSHLIDLEHSGSGVTSQLTIIIKDDDPPKKSLFALDNTTIIIIAVAIAAVLILIFLILLVSICICRCNASRQGFYITEEDKTANPPSMLRYSASLRSISSQAVVPIIDGKGQLAEKENEFYV